MAYTAYRGAVATLTHLAATLRRECAGTWVGDQFEKAWQVASQETRDFWHQHRLAVGFEKSTRASEYLRTMVAIAGDDEEENT
jgi:hypothetical protein